MSLYWDVVATKLYNEKLYNLIKLVEEGGDVSLSPYDDGEQNPSIGIGFNLTVSDVRSVVFDALLYPDRTPTSFERSADNTYRSQLIAAINSDDYSGIDDVMLARSNDISLTYPELRSSFSFNNESEVKAVFQILKTDYENQVNTWMTSIPSSDERIVLMSLAYNGLLAESNNLKAAVNEGYRAEAWYQIRYESNGNPAIGPGIAKRRYYESDVFGLHGDNDVPTLNDVIKIYQTMTRHREEIEEYEDLYGSQVGAAELDYGVNVSTTEESLELSKGILINAYASGFSFQKIWVDYTQNIDGSGSETDDLNFSDKSEDMLIIGFNGENKLESGSGNDYLIGGDDSDIIIANDGNDWLVGSAGADILNGGNDVDTADYWGAADGVTINLSTGTASDDGYGSADTLIGIENIRGSFWDDTIVGDSSNNVIYGSMGFDGIDGAGGINTIDYFYYDPAWVGTEGVHFRIEETTATVEKSPDTNYYIDTIENVDNFWGSRLDDTFAFEDLGVATKYAYGYKGRDTFYLSGVDTGMAYVDGGDDGDRYEAGGQNAAGYISINDTGITGYDLLYIDLIEYDSGLNAWVDSTVSLEADAYNMNLSAINLSSSFNIDISATGIASHSGLDVIAIKSLLGEKYYKASDLLSYASSAGAGYIASSTLMASLDTYVSTTAYQNGAWTPGSSGAGAGGNVLPTFSGGNITNMQVAPTHVNGTIFQYATPIYHPFVLTSYFISSGYSEFNFESEKTEIIFDSGITANDIRFGVSGGLGDANLIIYIDNLSYSYTINDFEAGKSLTGYGVYDLGMHAFAQGSTTAKMSGSADSNTFRGEYTGSTWGSLWGATSVYTYFVETISFASGGSINLQGTLTFAGTSAASDIIYGLNSRGDILTSGAGADSMYGQGGDDIYLWNIGDGNDTVSEGGGSLDQILFGEGIDVEDVRLEISSYSLLVHVGSSYLTISGQFLYAEQAYGLNSQVEKIVFSDEREIDLTGTLTFSGTSAASEIIYGLNSRGDILTSGAGADSMYGQGGDDIYLWNIGDGNDTVSEGGGSLDQILFGEGIDVEDVRLEINSYSLLVHVGSSYLTISGQFLYAEQAYGLGSQVEKIVFSDEREIDLTGTLTFTGTSGADYLYGLDSRGDTLEGKGGNDNLYGQGGDDILIGSVGADYLNGGSGDDTYLWNIGDGNDTISEGGGSLDQILFGEGIDVEDVRLEISGYNLFVHIGASFITISGQFMYVEGAGGINYQVEKIVFSDEREIDLTGTLTFAGTSGAEYIYGLNSRNDILEGKGGNDNLYGQGGDDTYLWNIGDGNDTVSEGGGSLDQILFGEGIDVEDVRLEINSYSLLVHVGSSYLTISGQFLYAEQAYGLGSQVEKIVFSDEREIDLTGTLTFAGTSGAEYIYGLNSRNDILEGKGGNDNLYGQGGDDTYLWNIGDGNDTISEGGGSLDQILFGEGIEVEDVRLEINSYSLLVHIGSSYLTISSQFLYAEQAYGLGSQVEKIVFSDEREIDLTGTLTFAGTSGAEYIYGLNSRNDILEGKGGNDNLYGQGGDDILIGGADADYLNGGSGSDTFYFEGSTAFSGVDNISDFNLGQFDMIDISDLLSGYDPLTHAIEDFVEITTSGSDSILKVDVDGGGNNFVQIATISGVTGLTDEGALVTSGALIVT